MSGHHLGDRGLSFFFGGCILPEGGYCVFFEPIAIEILSFSVFFFSLCCFNCFHCVLF